MAAFDIVAEVEPPQRPGDTRVLEQLASLDAVAGSYLVPDNHTSRATVSSLVIAGELARTGRRALACVNARDRNLLGFRRDLLTAAYLGVEELLLVPGDGAPAGGLTVRTMLEEARSQGRRAAVTTRLTTLPAWKREADRLFVQVSWSLDALLTWRDRARYDGCVHAGVMVMPSAAAARRIGARVPELAMPPALLAELERDPDAAVRQAVGLIGAIQASGAFDGVHLVAGSRHAEVAAALSSTPVGATP
jgi:5,10-methylenetetrahydrofolate reductase